VQRKLVVVTVLVAFLLLAFAGMVSAKGFDDVPKTHWAYDAVEYLASKGLVEGFPDGTYQGNKTMTRYELAMLVARAYAKMEDMMTKGDKPGIDTESVMNDLMNEFRPELDKIRELAEANKMKIDDLERKLKENSEKDADLASKLEKLGSKVQFNGTMKLRFDGKYYDPEDKREQRPRISFRFDMKAPVNDEVTFAARLGTGGEGANVASETTLTDEFGIKAFDLERAYLQWKPANWPNWTFWCGKYAPVWKTPRNFIDVDLNVEGASAQYEENNWLFNLSGMTPADKGGYIVAQVGEKDLFIKNLELYLTYHYASAGAFETLFTGYPYWNRLDAENYSAIEGYGKYSFDFMNWPMAVQAAYRQNLASELPGMPSGLQQAAMAQIDIGKIKEVKDYCFWVNFQRVLPNALIPQFDDSTYGSDNQSISAGLNYQLMNNVMFKFSWVYHENLVHYPDSSWNYICADVICDF